jgi:hypothetical protein
MRRMNYVTTGGTGRGGLFRLQLAMEFAAIFIGGPLAVSAVHQRGFLFLVLAGRVGCLLRHAWSATIPQASYVA